MRGGEGYGTADVLGELVRQERQEETTRRRAVRDEAPVITVPAHLSDTGHRHRPGSPVPRGVVHRWTATHPATGYPLTRHATHHTTAHAAEESPG
ncbi:hypothetical protein FSY75_37335 [Streptomyces sp. TR1341]|uniref:Uncharacterized protein n=1 Tax=Streptomyces griseofuscus TaxID=146922 RepID=A0A3R8Q8B9_9ACTN|nr:hypothetical protein [Streptomyces sp. TR1341]RRQ77489.1 hypothetical protein CQW39_18095 [Streptomyces griseofuscus]RRQ82723.1 hypothetical protein CQW44_27415 [Streptomyces griseofuscus]